MEAYSSSSSSSLARGLKVSHANFNASLHSVRNKPMTKPWKKSISPLQPTPPKVYKVDPINFRDLVQKLTSGTAAVHDHSMSHVIQPQHVTSSSSHLHHRLQRVAPPPPPPIQVAPPPPLMCGAELNLSPSSYNWYSFPILSPGTLSNLDQSTVL